MAEYMLDAVCLLIAVALLAGYHLFLWSRLRRDPHYTIQGVNAEARRAFVTTVMDSPKSVILGVQTLRNATMAASLLASTAVLLIMGTLTLSTQAEQLTASWHVLNAGGSHRSVLWIIKVLILLTNFLVAFFGAAMAIRLYKHVGFQLNVPPENRPPSLTPDCVSIHLNRAGRFFSISMRAFYLAVPLVFWLFGPLLMCAAALVLVVVLYYLDRTPRAPAGATDGARQDTAPS